MHSEAGFLLAPNFGCAELETLDPSFAAFQTVVSCHHQE
jgi:hypothetical protein